MGLKGGISIDADSGPLRYVLWCCGGICHQPDTFIQIGSGHTVGLSRHFLNSFPIVMHTYVSGENKSSLYSPSSLDAIGYEDYVLWKVYHLPKFGFPSAGRLALNCKQSSHETKQKP